MKNIILAALAALALAAAPARATTFVKDLMVISGTGGATISLDAERDRFALVKVFDCGGLDAAAFTEAVSKFASVLETWVKLVANWRFSPDEDAAQQDASTPDGSFILV